MKDIIELRNKLNSKKDISLGDIKTKEILKDYLTKIKIKYEVYQNSLIAYYNSFSKKTILLRVETIRENENKTCFNDINVLTTINILNKIREKSIPINLVIMFQIKEDNNQILSLIDNTILKKFKIDEAFQFNYLPSIKKNYYGVKEGVVFYNSCMFKITLLDNIKTTFNNFEIINRFIDILNIYKNNNKTTYLTIGEIINKENSLIQNEIELKGIIKTKHQNEYLDYLLFINKTMKSFEDIFDITLNFDIIKYQNEVINDAAIHNRILANLNCEIINEKAISNDFGYFSNIYPSYLLLYGNNSDDNNSNDYLEDNIIKNLTNDFLKII